MRTDRPEPGAFLCERCGYALDGLVAAGPGGQAGPIEPGAGACPECGSAVSTSMPERRTGSPWQRRPGVVSLVRTWCWTVCRPVTSWRLVSLGGGSTALLGLSTQLVAGYVLVLGIGLPRGVASAWTTGWLEMTALLAVLGLLAGAGFALLAAIERAGIRFFGGRRGWRITREVARAVTAHASVGWILGAAIFATGFHSAWSLAQDTRPGGSPIVHWLPAAIAIGSWVLALISFESLVYAGTRAMRFANRPGAGPARH